MIRYQLVRIMKKFFYPKETVDTLLTDKSSIEIQKSQVVDFPTSLPMASHTHPKSEITDFPATIPPSSHDHGNITNAGVITGKANKNVVTDNNGKITTEDKYSHPTQTAVTGVPASNLNLTFGGNFQVSQPIVNNLGHVTQLNSRTLSLPTLPVASTNQKGIIQIGSDSNSAAAGNHSHPPYLAGVGLTVSNNTFSVDEVPATEVVHTVTDNCHFKNITGANITTGSTIFQNSMNELIDTKFGQMETINSVSVQASSMQDFVTDGVIIFRKVNKTVIMDMNITVAPTTKDSSRYFCNVPTGYAPSQSIYQTENLPAVISSNRTHDHVSQIFLEYVTNAYQVKINNHMTGKHTLRCQLMWFTD